MKLQAFSRKELGYLGKKLVYRLTWRDLLARRKIAPGWAFVPESGADGTPELRPPIVFALSNRNYFHLGDAFFVLPLVRGLIESFGRDQVLVCTSPACSEIFELYGVRCVGDVLSPVPATIITFCEILFEDLSRIDVRKFVYANIDKGINMPVADWHARVFETQFGVRRSPFPQIDMNEADAIAATRGLKRKTVVVNDVVWSGKFRLRRGHAIRLQKKIDELAADGHVFCRLGAAGEPSQIVLPQDKTIDLRGAISIADVVRIFHSDKVVASVSYDNFFMHCALWAKKQAFVLCRERPVSTRPYMQSYIYRASAEVSPAQLHYL
jgi:hypothetical protein